MSKSWYEAGSTANRVGEELKRNKEKKRAVKTWFVISVQDGACRVMKKGEQIECLEYMIEYTEAHPTSKVPLYIASGVKILGY